MPIDRDSKDWPYEQVAAMIRKKIDTGEWGPQLPSYLKIAHQLEVAPMTVQRAIRELVAEGLVETKRGRGVFVRDAGA